MATPRSTHVPRGTLPIELKESISKGVIDIDAFVSLVRWGWDQSLLARRTNAQVLFLLATNRACQRAFSDMETFARDRDPAFYESMIKDQDRAIYFSRIDFYNGALGIGSNLSWEQMQEYGGDITIGQVVKQLSPAAFVEQYVAGPVLYANWPVDFTAVSQNRRISNVPNIPDCALPMHYWNLMNSGDQKVSAKLISDFFADMVEGFSPSVYSPDMFAPVGFNGGDPLAVVADEYANISAQSQSLIPAIDKAKAEAPKKRSRFLTALALGGVVGVVGSILLKNKLQE